MPRNGDIRWEPYEPDGWNVPTPANYVQGNIVTTAADVARSLSGLNLRSRRPAYLVEDDDAIPTARTNFMDIEHFDLTIGEALGKRGYQKTKEDAVIGLELENESVLNPERVPELSGWKQHQEGSLRYFGMEYVLSPPRDKETAYKLTEKLLEQFADCKIKLTNSRRTSVHVHFDVTKYKIADLLCFASLYWLLEDILAEYAGETRKDNLFCVRAKTSKYAPMSIAQGITKRTPFKTAMFGEGMRYSSLNLAAVTKFGSIESRLMRGSSDVNEIRNWVEMLDRIRLYALKFPNPYVLRKHLLDTSFEELPKAIFDGLKVSYPEDYADGMREAFIWIEPLLIAEKKWDFTDEIKKHRERQEAKAKALEEELRAQEETRRRRAEAVNRVYRQFSSPDTTDELPDQFNTLYFEVNHNQQWSDE